MSLLIPVPGAGEMETVTYERIYSSIGGLSVYNLELLENSGGAFSLEGTREQPATSGFKLNGMKLKAAFACLEQGENPPFPALAGIVSGLVQDSFASGSFEVAGDLIFRALASIVIKSNPTISGKYIYAALAAMAIYFASSGESYATSRQVGRNETGAKGALTIRETNRTYASASVSPSIQTVRESIASLEDGQKDISEALGSQDNFAPEGTQIIIDIINEILYGGHGDDC